MTAGSGSESSATPQEAPRRLAYLTMCALGVVYGDIGTSPLYAMNDCFFGDHGISVTPEHIFGVTSLILWALILIVSIKYLGIVLRADNQGEGGILALMALARRKTGEARGEATPTLFIGLFGAALLYGDGMITPAISVLSAVEGLPQAIPSLAPCVIPITLAVLCLVFFIQSRGTALLGRAFGPVIAVWFLTMAVLGVRQLIHTPTVLGAFNPYYAINYLAHDGWHGFLVLGSVFLAVTGAEALYADMGHFGKTPIRWGWFAMALPCLALNYLGQAALILGNPQFQGSLFYGLAPEWFAIPLVLLATCATVIASQALISGAFSLTNQAIQLGYLPRMEVRHTSSQQIGQIYVPWVNVVLFVSTICLVLWFRTSKQLASAYGFAVSFTLLLTTALVCLVMRKVWRWPLWRVCAVIGVFFVIETAFLVANGMKFFSGGWVPMMIAIVVFVLMTTWQRGRKIIADRLRVRSVALEEFFRAIIEDPPPRVQGTAVFMTRNPDAIPPSLLHNLRHNKVLHERVIFLTICSERHPYIGQQEAIEVEKLSMGCYRVLVHFGFMEKPALPPIFERMAQHGLPIDVAHTTFFLGSETPLPRNNNQGMALWREHLFAIMVRNAQKVHNFYELPPNQVVEMGLQVEM
jgi:KUP system potassium uptake protein